MLFSLLLTTIISVIASYGAVFTTASILAMITTLTAGTALYYAAYALLFATSYSLYSSVIGCSLNWLISKFGFNEEVAEA